MFSLPHWARILFLAALVIAVGFFTGQFSAYHGFYPIPLDAGF